MLLSMTAADVRATHRRHAHLSVIAEKFRSNVQRTAQILREQEKPENKGFRAISSA
jgi:hypothetical protein